MRKPWQTRVIQKLFQVRKVRDAVDIIKVTNKWKSRGFPWLYLSHCTCLLFHKAAVFGAWKSLSSREHIRVLLSCSKSENLSEDCVYFPLAMKTACHFLFLIKFLNPEAGISQTREKSPLQTPLIKTIVKFSWRCWVAFWYHNAIPPSSSCWPTSLLFYLSGFVSILLGRTSCDCGMGIYLIAHSSGGAVPHVLRCKSLCLILEELPNTKRDSTISGQKLVLEQGCNLRQFSSSCWAVWETTWKKRFPGKKYRHFYS